MSMSGPPAVRLTRLTPSRSPPPFLDAPSVPQDPITATADRLLTLQTDRLLNG